MPCRARVSLTQMFYVLRPAPSVIAPILFLDTCAVAARDYLHLLEINCSQLDGDLTCLAPADDVPPLPLPRRSLKPSARLLLALAAT
jgi:hypothetical protein